MPEETQASPPPEPKPKPDAKPDGWEKLRREGDPAGPAEVGYDARRHKQFHLNSAGEVVWHETPDGFAFRDGVLVKKETK